MNLELSPIIAWEDYSSIEGFLDINILEGVNRSNDKDNIKSNNLYSTKDPLSKNKEKQKIQKKN